MGETAVEKKASLLSFRALAGALMSRTRFAGRDGLSFEGKRDMYASLGYKKDLTAQDFYDRYLRDGVAHRIIEAFPTASWRGGGEIYEDPDPDTITPFEQAWKELNERLDIWGSFERLDIAAGIGRYGVMLIGAPGALDTPLEKVSADKIMYLRTYSELDAPVQQIEQNPEDPRFGEPVFYTLQRSSMSSFSALSSTTGSKRVHYTRVLHVAEGLIDNNVVGQSRIEKVWNLLDDLMKVSGGGAEAHWKRADGGLQLALDPEIVLDAAGKLALEEQIENYTHGLERIIRTQGVEMNRLGSDVADFKGPIGAIFDLISASTGIPQRILMGSERGKLASSNDQSNWDTRVSDRRQNFCYKAICRPFVDRLIALKALPAPKSYVADWPEIDELTEKEKVEVASKLAAMPQESGPIVLPSEIREVYLGLPPMTPEQIAEHEAIEKKKQEAAQQAFEEQKAMVEAKAAPKAEANLKAAEVGPAVQRALDKAIADGRRVLTTPALRAAMAQGDQELVRQLLARSVDRVEEALRA